MSISTRFASLALASLALVLAAAACTSTAPDAAPGKPHPRGALWRMQQRVGPDGTIARGAVLRAVAQRDAMAQIDGAAPNVTWTWMGPGNIGARLRAVLIHPSQPQTMWVGTAGGGVWKTTNGGGTWQPMNSVLSLLAIGCMAMDPTDPDRLYAGTGEGFFETEPGTSILAAMLGAGIFTSTDGGATWAQLPATAAWQATNRIAIDPVDPRVLLAGTSDGLYRSTDRGGSWQQTSTADTLDVQYHPVDSSLAVAGTAAGRALYSTDGGQSWSTATGITGAVRVEVRYFQGNPAVVYATVNGTGGTIRVYRSNDGGRSYAVRTQGSGVACLGGYNNGLWVDPTNEQRLLVGATRVHRSTNGGISLTEIVSGGYYDYHAFAQHPGFNGTSNRTVFSGSDGGVHRLGDVAASFPQWQELNNNLGINQFYGAAIHAGSGVIIGGTQDQGTLRYNGGTETWTQPAGGDGGFTASDPLDPRYFYGEYYWLSLFRSTDGGQSFSSIAFGINESTPNFIAPFILDPNDSSRMLAGGAQLWRTNNVKVGQPAWTSIKPALNCPSPVPPAHYLADPPCNISAIGIAPGNSASVWVGHNNGEIWKTPNGLSNTPAWTRVDAGVPDRWVSRLVVDPRDERRVYASLMGYAPDNLWLTEDAGLTWRGISGSAGTALPDSPISGLAVHPRNQGVLFAGTDVGTFASLDDGGTWQVVPGGPINAAIEQLVWQDQRTLLVVTHGLSIYKAALEAATVTAAGTGCGVAGAPTLTATPPVVGATQRYDAAGLGANAAVSLFAAAGPASPTSLGGGCALQTALGSTVVVPAGQTDPSGSWTLLIPLPDDTALLGATLTVQVAAAVAGGPVFGVAELTNGLELTLGF